ncbi:BLUF domain-containing protein [Hymenobacter sediminis]|uniref:BLUF domain-containing protein n=1 Tax=Hymenobacter sediminis TaxID=2218621 RepID=UPI000F516ABB|nr:BLUF domain-containing protein [Hymenobacter sediminis]RPD45224.1 BLUF domain-containing protein [Hymenobacter sediminis]
MHHIIYMSRSVQSLGDEQLRTLLEQARQANTQAQITGLLVYGNGQFMQVLEGEEAALQALYQKLQADPRHAGVVKLADKAIEHRSFSEWSMGFHAATPAEFAQLTGYVAPEQVELNRVGLSEADTLLLQLMHSFVLQPHNSGAN